MVWSGELRRAVRGKKVFGDRSIEDEPERDEKSGAFSLPGPGGNVAVEGGVRVRWW